MSNFKRMVFKLDPDNREAEGQLVERYLTALGYEDAETWNDERRHDNTRKHIFVDGVKFMYFTDDCHELATLEPIPTSYKVAVAEHVPTAPKELAEYVRGRLVSSNAWRDRDSPVFMCGFVWNFSVEGYDFWRYIDIKDWSQALATKFWQKHTNSSKKEFKETVKDKKLQQSIQSQNNTETMKGKIGYWYTLLDNVVIKLDHGEAIYSYGFTWQCTSLDDKGNPMLKGGCVIPTWASYRSATTKEVFSALQKLDFTAIGKAAEQFAEIAEDKKQPDSTNFEDPIKEPEPPVAPYVIQDRSDSFEEVDEKLVDIYSVDEVLLFYQMRAVEAILKNNNKEAIYYLKKVDRIRDQQ